jgi:hypothetical protein
MKTIEVIQYQNKNNSFAWTVRLFRDGVHVGTREVKTFAQVLSLEKTWKNSI